MLIYLKIVVLFFEVYIMIFLPKLMKLIGDRNVIKKIVRKASYVIVKQKKCKVAIKLMKSKNFDLASWSQSER